MSMYVGDDNVVRYVGLAEPMAATTQPGTLP